MNGSERKRIAGQSWRVTRKRSASRHEKWGEVDFKRRTVFISPEAEGQRLAETVIHEIIHVWFPGADEDWVAGCARDAARIYWALREAD